MIITDIVSQHAEEAAFSWLLWSNAIRQPHYNKRRFTNGTRYLCGQPIAVESLNQVLRTGKQRWCRAAAIELAMRQPGQPLFNCSAPGFQQQKLLN